jgi:hypothetical protein
LGSLWADVTSRASRLSVITTWAVVTSFAKNASILNLLVRTRTSSVRAWWARDLDVGGCLTLLHTVESRWTVAVRVRALDIVLTILCDTINIVEVTEGRRGRSLVVHTVLLCENWMEGVVIICHGVASLGGWVVPIVVTAGNALVHSWVLGRGTLWAENWHVGAVRTHVTLIANSA